MAMATVSLGISTHSQSVGIIRSLTDDFLRARVSTRRSRGDVSDSEDVRWVSCVVERERERERLTDCVCFPGYSGLVPIP